MDQCPKCGGHRILGPSYKRSPYGTESLRYVCSTCGYATETPTRDTLTPEKGE